MIFFCFLSVIKSSLLLPLTPLLPAVIIIIFLLGLPVIKSSLLLPPPPPTGSDIFLLSFSNKVFIPPSITPSHRQFFFLLSFSNSLHSSFHSPPPPPPPAVIFCVCLFSVNSSFHSPSLPQVFDHLPYPPPTSSEILGAKSLDFTIGRGAHRKPFTAKASVVINSRAFCGGLWRWPSPGAWLCPFLGLFQRDTAG